ncbi:uncharacterized protein BDZ99DRAFT_89432 [Mytilinidion resinicola]|uniref:Uncharacterized protein n=1 Tax=Mytilinidion resinicola TaxID=574789 RepID=A0A6A6YG16_9PEZI|nr:uncharacterized protein BDZ99DRAFT_89432 [Mytilinidion resinicola]KAF2806985.1 hypothetical protein BDZ99DRAFT_89432 [Mytilinidion resinicola]
MGWDGVRSASPLYRPGLVRGLLLHFATGSLFLSFSLSSLLSFLVHTLGYFLFLGLMAGRVREHMGTGIRSHEIDVAAKAGCWLRLCKLCSLGRKSERASG